jgi:cell division protein FtsB
MKISKITWIILGVVVLGVVFFLLYMMYSKQLQEQDQLKSQISANQASVSRLVAEQQKFQSQLTALKTDIDRKNQAVANANNALAIARSAWTSNNSTAESIEYEEKLFSLAEGWDLAVSVTTGTEANIQPVQTVNFVNTTFTVTVTGQPLTSGFDELSEYQSYVYGKVDDIISFLNDINQDSFFRAARIDFVNITVPDMPATEDDLVDTGINVAQPIATVNITIYTYNGG